MYVNVYSTDPNASTRIFLDNYANVYIMPDIWRVEASVPPRSRRPPLAMRIRLNPDRMRAHNLSSEDIIDLLGV